MIKAFRIIITTTLIVAVMVGIPLYFLPPITLSELSAENGVIEYISVFALLSSALCAAFAGWYFKSGNWYLYSFFMAMACLRELDVHKMFTTMSIFKTRFYLSAEVPVTEKAIGAIIIFILLFAAYKAAKNLIPSLKKAFNGMYYVVTAYMALGFFALGKFLDAFFRFLPSMREHKGDLKPYLTFTEESVEMAAAVLLFAAPVAYIANKRKRS